jgi:hypothetical protein
MELKALLIVIYVLMVVHSMLRNWKMIFYLSFLVFDLLAFYLILAIEDAAFIIEQGI